ncbi:MAG: hypothetical protein NVS3B20_06130 [Polyangiales bacterium]
MVAVLLAVVATGGAGCALAHPLLRHDRTAHREAQVADYTDRTDPRFSTASSPVVAASSLPSSEPPLLASNTASSFRNLPDLPDPAALPDRSKGNDHEPPSQSAADDPTFTVTSGAPPAVAYGSLDSQACASILKTRGIAHVTVDSAFGVAQPIRLTGALHGVHFHGLGSQASWATSPYEIIDCRLALALDDFAVILAAHGVIEALHMSIYRPAAKTIAHSANSANAVNAEHRRHEAALAIDLGTLKKRDGSTLSVLDDWHGRIGDKTCVPSARPTMSTPKSLEIRQIFCAAAEAKLFNVMLTPNYNPPHANHFHLEVTHGVKWFIVH